MNNLNNNPRVNQAPIANVGNPQHYEAPRVINYWMLAVNQGPQGPLNAFANIALAHQEMHAGNGHIPKPGV